MESNTIQRKLNTYDHYYYKERIVYLYFYLTGRENIDKLSLEMDELLMAIKKHKNETLPYLVLLCKLILHTRDKVNGKGERSLAYMMIYRLYKYYPFIAIHLVKTIVGTNNEDIGCWKDIRCLCEYVREHSLLKENHPLISNCVDILIKQIYRDVWGDWMRCDTNSDVSAREISLAAKWVPREHKKFHWLYEKIVLAYANKYYNYMFGPTLGNYEKAMNKCKRNFRIMVSNLCVELNSKKNTCNYKEMVNIQMAGSPKIMNLHASAFVKNAVALIENTASRGVGGGVDGNGGAGEGGGGEVDNIRRERKSLNRLWKKYIKSCSTIENMIPVIDICLSLEDNSREHLYNAIGIACLICEKSTISKRVLCISKMNSCVWINLDNCIDFLDMVHEIYNVVNDGYTNSKVNMAELAVDLIIETIVNTNMTSENIEKMNIVFLQNKVKEMQYSDLYTRFYGCIWNGVNMGKVPYMIFWNVGDVKDDGGVGGVGGVGGGGVVGSGGNTLVLPCNINTPRVAVISGCSPSILNHFCFLGFSGVRNMTIYETLCNILMHNRYSVLEDTIHRMAGM